MLRLDKLRVVVSKLLVCGKDIKGMKLKEFGCAATLVEGDLYVCMRGIHKKAAGNPEKERGGREVHRIVQ